MKSKVCLIIVLSQLFSYSSYAKGTLCKGLADCVQRVSKLTGKKYFYGKDLKGDVKSTTNFELNMKNADTFISMALNENGYTRVPLVEKNSFRIIHARDIRYTPVPIFIAGETVIPENDDYIMMTVNLKFVNSTEVTRSFRPFMSRYGRIIDIKQKNRIIVQDTGKNAKRLLHLIKTLDIPLSSKEKDFQENRLSHSREIEILKAKHCGNGKGK